ncbi:MAG: hypothetical protein AABX13_03040 [Nanoarchaeota archaeon]
MASLARKKNPYWPLSRFYDFNTSRYAGGGEPLRGEYPTCPTKVAVKVDTVGIST